MTERNSNRYAVARFFVALALISFAPGSIAQLPTAAAQATEEKLQFDAASIRLSREGGPSSNVPLGVGNVAKPTGGLLIARHFPLLTYITFAYKTTDYQERSLDATLPDWAATDRFDIEARTENRNVTKDQLRVMMRALLAERFGLTVHYQTREVSVYALVPVRPGATGPHLRSHPIDAACGTGYSAKAQQSAGGFPSVCGGILGLPGSAQDRYSFGAANVPMSLIASSLSSWGNLGRPVIDRTGLTGAYDFVLDYTPGPRPAYATVDSGGPTFQQALIQQLGLKLEAQKAPVDFLVIDHVERPSAN